MNNLKLTLLLLFASSLLYAQPVSVTRIDGVGAGNNFLDISEETRVSICLDTNNGEITYLPDQGPIKVSVTNTANFTLGNYKLTLIDENLANNSLDSEVFWQLTHVQSGTTVTSDATITSASSQFIPEFGITIEIIQIEDPGQMGPNNGVIGFTTEYANDQGVQWFSSIPDEYGANPEYLNYIKTDPGEVDNDLDPNQNFTPFGDGSFNPYTLCDWRPSNSGPPNYLSPSWIDPNSEIVQVGNGLDSLNNVDLVFTSDKSKWSRCVIVETAMPQYSTELGLETEGNAGSLDLRDAPSVGPDDTDLDGFPDPDGDGTGMGWFPGYAVDLETGKRLNVFFGENSVYSLDQNQALLDEYDITEDDFDTAPTGRDMLWNPTSEILIDAGDPDGFRFQHYMGGQHYIYVTREEYDECEGIREDLNGSNIPKIFAMRKITWTTIPVLSEGTSLLSLADGLIPNDFLVKLRVDNPFQVTISNTPFNGYPTYQFEVQDPVSTTNPQEDDWTKTVDLSPNPYSSIEHPSLQLHQLPADCMVSLYDLSGQQLWQKEYQNVPSSSVVSVASSDLAALGKGVYFIRIHAENQSWKVLKWVVI